MMSQPIQQGGRLGRYQLITRLATGGMAEVWLARATGAKGFQKTIVVKTILPHLADDPDFLRMFIDEALLAAALNHPNIVQIFDLGQIGEHYFIAMEFILGRTMRQVQRVLRKQRKVMPPWLVLRVAVAVCDALEYAHNRRGDDGELLGIVHRDVTPENIMISFSGVTKVVDFGIAKATTSANITRAGKIKGKLAYLAPEQIINAGKNPVDRRTDIYALGVLLYEMLTGVRPFRAPNDMALLLKIPKETPTPPCEIARWVPTRLSNIVMLAMAKDPEKRYQNSAELGEELEAFLTSVGTYPTERHVSAYMCKLFDEEERRIPTLSAGTSARSMSGAQSTQRSVDTSLAGDIKGPDSAASISIEVSVEQTYTQTDREGAGSAESVSPKSSSGESGDGMQSLVPDPAAARPSMTLIPRVSDTRYMQSASEKVSKTGSATPNGADGKRNRQASDTEIPSLTSAAADVPSVADDLRSSTTPSAVVRKSALTSSVAEPKRPTIEPLTDDDFDMMLTTGKSIATVDVPLSTSSYSVQAPSIQPSSSSVDLPKITAKTQDVPLETPQPKTTPSSPSKKSNEKPSRTPKKEAKKNRRGSDPWTSKPKRTAAWDAVVRKSKTPDEETQQTGDSGAKDLSLIAKSAEVTSKEAEKGTQSGHVWDTISSRQQYDEEISSESKEDVAVEEGNSGHAWDAFLRRSRDVASEEQEESESGDEIAEGIGGEDLTGEQKVHMWDAFIRSRGSSQIDDDRGVDAFLAARRRAATPRPIESRQELGWWKGQQDTHSQAAAKFDEGLALVRKGRLDEALMAWERAVELDPENRKYIGNLRMLRKTRDKEGG